MAVGDVFENGFKRTSDGALYVTFDGSVVPVLAGGITLGSATNVLLKSDSSGGLLVRNTADTASAPITVSSLRTPNGANTEYAEVAFSSNTAIFRTVANGGTDRSIAINTSASAGVIALQTGGNTRFQASSTAFIPSAAATQDLGSTANSFRSVYFDTSVTHQGANGQSLALLKLTELTTIAAAATTDTVIQMPAGAIVLAVSVRVTVVIPTAASFTVGDSGSAARFSTAAVSSAATSTDAGTKAGAYYNAGALSVRITPNAQPADNTGRVRVTIFYWLSTPPTS